MYNPDIHNRKSIRLKEYDYSKPGWYFITICTQQRECLFGEIIDKNIKLSSLGDTALECWIDIPVHYPNVDLDAFVVMPNHVHGIISINENTKYGGVQNIEPLPEDSSHNQNKFQHIIPCSIGTIIRGFKIGVIKWVRENTDIKIVWQRNYYEHIIRNHKDLIRIREYIFENPCKWELNHE